jgi:very-short-patch-repair endonuclease
MSPRRTSPPQREQAGVVSRAQLLAGGTVPHEIRRRLRRRELVVVHPGIYVDHTGPLTWEQRAWAAVLGHWPAALTRESALAEETSDGPIQVAIAQHRSVEPLDGVRAHRTSDLEHRVQWHRSPPRVRVEHAAIDLAASKRDAVARFRVLADVVQSRATTAERLATTLAGRRGTPGRAQLLDLLHDLADGACSVLEREYLLLERRHGLGSTSQRQQADRVGGNRVYRDVDHPTLGVVVELDGRAFHDTAAGRDGDALRDLETIATDGRITVRLTWAMVVQDGCRTMAHVAAVLRRRGWSGRLTPCAGCPPVVEG